MNDSSENRFVLSPAFKRPTCEPPKGGTQNLFSLFQGVATSHEGSSENQFVVPPLGGSVGCRSIPVRQTLPPKGRTTNCAFHSFRASPRHIKAPQKPRRL